jgi:acyl-CoA thioesterase
MPDTPTHEFDADTAVTHTAAGHYQAEITDRWNIGANPNGGYLLAAAARAIAQEVPNHPDPFTVTAHYLRPGEAGTADISVEVVRTGRKLATLRSTVSQGGKGKLEILATFGDLADHTSARRLFAPSPVQLRRFNDLQHGLPDRNPT